MKKFLSGGVNILLIVVMVMSVALAGLAGLSVWLYTQYADRRDNVDNMVSEAVARARKEQSEAYEARFLEREKEPNREFVGPEDYGRLSFMYPRTWSVHEARDASAGGTYEAYFHPVVVPPITRDQIFALRVRIELRDYATVLRGFENAVQRGELTTRSINIEGVQATRFDGQINREMRGSIVVFRIRNMTVTLQTDAETFRGDFDALIRTINFNA